MVALRDLFSFGTRRQPQGGFSSANEAYEFAQKVYRETNGATPELRKLMSEYREMKRSGKVRVNSGRRTDQER